MSPGCTVQSGPGFVVKDSSRKTATTTAPVLRRMSTSPIVKPATSAGSGNRGPFEFNCLAHSTKMREQLLVSARQGTLAQGLIEIPADSFTKTLNLVCRNRIVQKHLTDKLQPSLKLRLDSLVNSHLGQLADVLLGQGPRNHMQGRVQAPGLLDREPNSHRVRQGHKQQPCRAHARGLQHFLSRRIAPDDREAL